MSQIQYTVVFNELEQHSIWPADKTLPNGWQTDDFSGAKKDCLDYIEQKLKDGPMISERIESEAAAEEGASVA